MVGRLGKMKKANFTEGFLFLKRKLSPVELKKQFTEIIGGITKKDLIILLIFPIIITLLMFLPEEIVQILRLSIKESSWWQYVTHSFVHTDWAHYKSNIFAYFLYTTGGFLLANLRAGKREFYKLFLFLIISLPIISTFIQVSLYPVILDWLPNLKYSSGSSGIVSGLAGFLPMFWIIYIKKRNPELKIGVSFLLIFIVYMTLAFALIYGQKVYLILLVLLMILGFLILINRSVLKISSIEIFKETGRNLLLAWVMIIVPLFYIITPYIIFPSVKILFNNSSFVDIGMHYVGITYGLIISGLYFLFIKK